MAFLWVTGSPVHRPEMRLCPPLPQETPSTVSNRLGTSRAQRSSRPTPSNSTPTSRATRASSKATVRPASVSSHRGPLGPAAGIVLSGRQMFSKLILAQMLVSGEVGGLCPGFPSTLYPAFLCLRSSATPVQRLQFRSRQWGLGRWLGR